MRVPVHPGGLYPAIGMHSEGEEVRLHLDAEWEQNDIILMSIDNYDEEWARLHDIRVNGMVSGRSYVCVHRGNQISGLIIKIVLKGCKIEGPLFCMCCFEQHLNQLIWLTQIRCTDS